MNKLLKKLLNLMEKINVLRLLKRRLTRLPHKQDACRSKQKMKP